MREAQLDEGNHYWECILLYMDDALFISTRTECILKGEIGKYFVMKPGFVCRPNMYFGNIPGVLVYHNI